MNWIRLFCVICLFVAFLSPARADWNLLERDLYVAIEKGNSAEVRRLIDKGADVNSPHPVHGKTPLALAMEKPRPDIIAMLMNAGAQTQGVEDLDKAARHAEEIKKNQVKKEETKVGWTMRLAEMKADPNPPSGRVQYLSFHPDRITFKEGVLRLSEFRGGVLPEMEVVIHLVLQKGDNLSGKQYRITPETKLAPKVEINWKKPGQAIPETRSFDKGYAMLLQFDRVDEAGNLKGMLYLSLPGKEQSYVRGSFTTLYDQAMTAQALASQIPEAPPVNTGPTDGMSPEDKEAMMAILRQAGMAPPEEEGGDPDKEGVEPPKPDKEKKKKVTIPTLPNQQLLNLLAPAQQEDTPATKLIALLWVVASLVGWWKVFTKAHHPGWASIIPIYNFWVWLRMAGKPTWYLILLIIPLVNFFVIISTMHGISKNFGQNALFTVGLIFLQPIFILILAFGDAVYSDPEARDEAARFMASMAGAELVARNRQNTVQREE